MPEYRRNLPHIHPDEAELFITWRLWGTYPVTKDLNNKTAGEAFVAQDRILDKTKTGPLYLNNPQIAEAVAKAITKGATEKNYYHLNAWVVMPNHIHILIHPKVPVSVLMRWLRGSTARQANEILLRTGQPFWQDEAYDHYLRNQTQRQKITAYIEQNPVTAGLVTSSEDWPWSSAHQQTKTPNNSVAQAFSLPAKK